MSSSTLSYLYSRTALSLFLRLGGVGLMFLAMILLARILSQAQFGLYVYVIDTVALASTAVGLGMNQIAVRVVPDAIAGKQEPLLRRFAAIGIAITLLSSLALWPVMEGARNFGLLPESMNTGVVAICVALLFATGVTRLAQEMLRGGGQIGSSQVFEQILWPIILLCLSAIAMTGWVRLEASGVLLVQASVFVVASALLFWLFFHRRKADAILEGPGKRVGVWADSREWLTISLPLAGAGLLSVFLSRGDILVLGSVASAEDLASYAAAARVAGLLLFALAAANAATAPLMRNFWVANEKDQLQHVTDRASSLATLLASPLAFAALLFPELILSLFGPGFVSGATALRILAVGQFVNALTGPVGPLMVAVGKQGAYARFVAVSALLCAALLFVLTPRYGLTGAAIATCTSAIVLNASLAFYLARRYRLMSFARLGAVVQTFAELADQARSTLRKI